MKDITLHIQPKATILKTKPKDELRFEAKDSPWVRADGETQLQAHQGQ